MWMNAVVPKIFCPTLNWENAYSEGILLGQWWMATRVLCPALLSDLPEPLHTNGDCRPLQTPPDRDAVHSHRTNLCFSFEYEHCLTPHRHTWNLKLVKIGLVEKKKNPDTIHMVLPATVHFLPPSMFLSLPRPTKRDGEETEFSPQDDLIRSLNSECEIESVYPAWWEKPQHGLTAEFQVPLWGTQRNNKQKLETWLPTWTTISTSTRNAGTDTQQPKKRLRSLESVPVLQVFGQQALPKLCPSSTDATEVKTREWTYFSLHIRKTKPMGSISPKGKKLPN